MQKFKVSRLGFHPTFRPQRMDLMGFLCMAWWRAQEHKKTQYVLQPREGYYQVRHEPPTAGEYHEVTPQGEMALVVP